MPSCNICDESFHTDSPLTKLMLVEGDNLHPRNILIELNVCGTCLDGNINEVLKEIEEALRSR